MCFKTEHSPARYNIIVKFMKFEDVLVHVDSRPLIGYLLFELLASYGTKIGFMLDSVNHGFIYIFKKLRGAYRSLKFMNMMNNKH